MATYTTKINRFDRSVVNDPRSPSGCRIVTNFDILIDPRRMIPYRTSEAGDAAGNTKQIQNFCVGYDGSVWKLYGLGKQSALSRHEIFYKALTTGAATDLDDDDWGELAKQQAGAYSQEFACFVYYKQTGLIYGLQGGRYVFAFDPTGTDNFDDTEEDLTSFAKAAQGLVHSKDDILYIPYDNKIAKFDGTTWTATALTLPDHFYITSICEDGNYLNVAAAPLSGIGKSVVYQWDRDASLATLSESIDWGEGILQVLEEVEGVIIGISHKSASTFNLDDKVIIKYLSGNKARKLIEFNSTDAAVAQPKQKVKNELYFMMGIILNGTIRDGVWSIGRNSLGEFVLSHRSSPNNDTSIHSLTTALSGALKNFIQVGDFLFISYIDESGASAYAISKTLATATYTAKSIFESLIDNGKHKGFDSSVTKKLKGVTVMFQPLPSATAQVVLQYQKDEDIGGATWTTIFTKTGANAISHSAINISGVTLPQYKEIQYRIISTKNAVLTGFKSKWEVIDKDIYST